MTVPIIGQSKKNDDHVKFASWGYEAGFKAAIRVLERLPLREKHDEDETYLVDELVSSLDAVARSVQPLAQKAAKQVVNKRMADARK